MLLPPAGLGPATWDAAARLLVAAQGVQVVAHQERQDAHQQHRQDAEPGSSRALGAASAHLSKGSHTSRQTSGVTQTILEVNGAA